MGIGLVIAFWAMIGSIILASYLLLSRLGKRSPHALLLKKVLGASVAAFGIVIVLMVVINVAQGFLPRRVFESSFGFDPPSDVVEVKGKRFVFGDSGSAYLRFRADKRTVEQIIGSRFVEIDERRFRSQSASALESAPSYWQPFEGKATRYYEADRFDDSFGFSYAVLSYDESNSVAHFYWVGVD